MRKEWRLLVPEFVRGFSADLVGVIGLVIATFGAVALTDSATLRTALALPFVLFLPGYALLSALYPQAAASPDGEHGEGRSRRSLATITPSERAILSVGVSVALSALLTLLLNFTPMDIDLWPILWVVGGFTVVSAVLASYRRSVLPPNARFSVEFQKWLAHFRSWALEARTKSEVGVNVVLIASLILATVSVGYVVAVPQQGDGFTELYLMAESGERVDASKFPRNFSETESKTLYVGIENHEHQTQLYTVVVELQRVAVENDTARVLQSQQLNRFRARVQAGDRWRLRHTISPSMTGDQLRLTYQLYRGSQPDNLTSQNPYRQVHVWINVSQS